MAELVLMPKVGISVESCIISGWKKKVGDAVKPGDILFDYETDKAAMECESTAEGVLLGVFYGDGDEVEVLSPVCAIGSAGEDISGIAPQKTAQEGVQDTPLAPAAAPEQAGGRARHGLAASPRAKRMAERLGLDASQAMPTGPAGRVIARDVEQLDALRRSPDAPVRAADAPVGAMPEAGGAYTDETLPKIRTIIAQNMQASLQQTAQLTHHHSFDASSMLALRESFKSGGAPYEGITLGAMILYAVSRVLPRHPQMNAHLLEGKTLRRFAGVNLGVAVDTPRGLMVPTVFGAHEKSLLAISDEVRGLAQQAKSGNISPDALAGASFTVSNLGNTGVEMFTPILNPPQVGIIGVCGVTTRVKQTENGLAAYPAMGLSLTYDHRAVDGAPAARFMQELCGSLERFGLLLAE